MLKKFTSSNNFQDWKEAFDAMNKKWDEAIDAVNTSINRAAKIEFQRTFPKLGKIKRITGEIIRGFSNDPTPSFVLKARNNRRIEIFMDELHEAVVL